MPDAALGSERKEKAGARPRVIALARVAPSRIAAVRIAWAFARQPRRTRRPLGGDVPAQVLDRAAADGSRDDLGRDDPARAGIRAAFVSRIAVDSVSLWLGGVRLRRLAVSRRRVARAPRPPPRDDDAHLARHHGGIRVQPRRDARRARCIALVGAIVPRHDHAARPLDGNAVDRAGPGGARRTREAPAEHGYAHRAQW